MDLQALDVMREIGSIGTSHAATALSKLLQKEVRISIPSVNILGYNDAMNRILQMRYWKNCLEAVISPFWIWTKWPDQHW